MLAGTTWPARLAPPCRAASTSRRRRPHALRWPPTRCDARQTVLRRRPATRLPSTPPRRRSAAHRWPPPRCRARQHVAAPAGVALGRRRWHRRAPLRRARWPPDAAARSTDPVPCRRSASSGAGIVAAAPSDRPLPLRFPGLATRGGRTLCRRPRPPCTADGRAAPSSATRRLAPLVVPRRRDGQPGAVSRRRGLRRRVGRRRHARRRVALRRWRSDGGGWRLPQRRRRPPYRQLAEVSEGGRARVAANSDSCAPAAARPLVPDRVIWAAMARIADLLAAGRTFSFEFFPPRTDAAQLTLGHTIAELEPLAPSFVSVTYGAGGTTRERTHQVVAWIRRRRRSRRWPTSPARATAGPRWPTSSAPTATPAWRTSSPSAAMRPPTRPTSGRATTATPASSWRTWSSEGSFSVGVAAHPELHPRSPDRESDRRFLAAKLARRRLRHHPVLLRGRALRPPRRGARRRRLLQADRAGDHAGHQPQPGAPHGRAVGHRVPGVAGRAARWRPRTPRRCAASASTSPPN